MRMVWDDPKRRTNIATHQLDFADAQDRFEWSSALIAKTHSGSDGRVRFSATGIMDESLVTLVFSPLGTEAIAAVSLRPASRKERRAYAKT